MSLQKLKAGLAAVINDNTETLGRAKDFYYSNATLYLNSDDEQKLKKTNHTYQYFYQNDMNFILDCKASSSQATLDKT